MPITPRLVFPLLLTGLTLDLFAQNAVISWQNPANLFVCGADTLEVTVQNTTTVPLNAPVLRIELPAGVEYLPGTASGASETNIADPESPEFTFPQIAGGASATLTLVLKAGCELLDAINAGNQFANTFTLSYTGGSQQITTDFFKIETALLLIEAVAPTTQSGTIGDVFTRTVTVRNTRQGPIATLRFRDQHQPGISIQLAGAAGQNTPVLFSADVQGTFFTAFGDGDELFEFDEVVTLTEQITITDCGIPEKTIKSDITAGWGCDAAFCQSDSAEAFVTIKTSQDNPFIAAIPLYAPPKGYCGNAPSLQEFILINLGNAPAEDINVSLLSGDSMRLGIDIQSIRVDTGSGWMPVSDVFGIPGLLTPCEIDSFYRQAGIGLPGLAPGDSLRVQFETRFCQYPCRTDNEEIRGIFSYKKLCPAGSVASGTFSLEPNEAELAIDSKVYFDIGTCMENGATYTFDYWIESKQLQSHDGYLRLELVLPWGIFWDDNCVPVLDGQSPLVVDVASVPDTQTVVSLVYDLPFSTDSVAAEFCLRNICQAVSTYEPLLPNLPPVGEDYVLYPSDNTCSACIRELTANSLLVNTPDIDDDCGLIVCDPFELVLDCGCDEDTTTNFRVTEFDSWRLNVGLRDDDNDRKADSFEPATAPQVRLDRFLPGDTMRTLTRGVVEGNNLDEVRFRIFNESWQSDFGLAGGDAYEMLAAKTGFTDANLLRYIDGTMVLTIAGSGQQYTCPIGAAAVISDRHFVQIAEPNIRPEEIKDRFASMFHEFAIDLPLLATTGCVPAGLKLQTGDSVVFTGDFKFFQNFVPASAVDPPLINFRNSACDTRSALLWKFDRCLPPLLRQYSGYSERVITPVFKINACQNAQELSPFRYAIRIARENLFPYEVRRLSALSTFRHSLPTGVPLLEARLNFMNMQESIPLFGTQVMTSTGTDKIELDFQSFFSDPVDEGHSLEAGFILGPACAFDGPKIATTQVLVSYFSDFFHNPDPFQIEIVNPFTYEPGKPELELQVQDTLLEAPDGHFQLDLLFENETSNPVPNMWVSWETTGDLSGVQLSMPPLPQPYPAIGNLFQIGQLDAFDALSLRLEGDIESCEPVFLTLRYGWDCEPVSNPGADVCGIFEKRFLLTVPDPEIELVVTAQPDELPVCAPSDIFEFEIYNAAAGVAFEPVGTIKLPPGLTVVPGSSRLSYPVGTPFSALSDPQALPGNVWQWTPSTASTALASKGLRSIDLEPENALRIRFRVQAACGFVANTRPVYGADAVRPCGAQTNILRKPGDPLQLEGFGPSYDIAANLVYASAQGGSTCGETAVLNATLIADGIPNPGDSIYVVLPAGVSYVPGSYQPLQNAPGNPPQVTGNTLQWPFPANLAANAVVQFNFEIRYDSAAACADRTVVLQARERVAVFCPLINQNCSAYIATGEALLALESNNADLVLQNFETAVNNNVLSFEATLLNTGGGTASDPLVQFYIDQNGNGQVDAGEPLVASVQPGQSLAPGAGLSLAGTLGLPPADLCRLIALIPGAENCACSDKVFPIGIDPVLEVPLGFCNFIAAPLGVDSIAGNTYTWLTPGGLSCTDCAQAFFTPDPGAGSAATLILEEKTPTCTVQYRFLLQYDAAPAWSSPDRFICRGESVLLEPPAGGTYQWSGPGIQNPSAAVQLVQPTLNSTYAVTVTYTGGCTGTGTATVYVFEPDSTDLGSITTCAGQLVDVFGTLTDLPGLYARRLKNTDGCDSVVTLRLRVSPAATFEVRPVCPGDSVTVFDSVFTAAGQLCRDFVTSAGCDSTHCVGVEVLPEPVLPVVQDSFVIGAGEEIQLSAPEGFESYAWTPSEGLSCADCPDPLASPDTSTRYLLTVADANGCGAAAIYRVLLCDFEGLDVPNAFTPNGDGVNDVFRVVPSENIAQVRSLSIYNRWGQKVWQGNGDKAEWDGSIDGKPAASDVYVWILRGTCGDALRERKGDVALLR